MSLRGEFFWRENFGCLREFWEIEEKLERKKNFREISREKNFEREKFAAVEQALATRRIHLQRALGASACAIIW